LPVIRFSPLFLISCFIGVGAFAEASAITIDDGMVHIIDAGNSFSETVHVFDGAGGPTTVLIVDGGFIADIVLNDPELIVHDTSTVVMTGGGIEDDLGARDMSTVDIFGGEIGSPLGAPDCCNGSVNAAGFSTINVFGGTMGGVSATGSGTMNIFGGLFESLQSNDLGTVNIFGFDLELSGVPTSTGGGLLTGTLKDGTILNATVFEGSGSINLHLIPEPSATLLFATGLAVVAVAQRRRRGGR
jgi:hypothetical protein